VRMSDRGTGFSSDTQYASIISAVANTKLLKGHAQIDHRLLQLAFSCKTLGQVERCQ
jgi:hypothetical protein